MQEKDKTAPFAPIFSPEQKQEHTDPQEPTPPSFPDAPPPPEKVPTKNDRTHAAANLHKVLGKKRKYTQGHGIPRAAQVTYTLQPGEEPPPLPGSLANRRKRPAPIAPIAQPKGRPNIAFREPAILDQICTAIRFGATRQDAADEAGIALVTLERWLAEGHKFFIRVQEAYEENSVEGRLDPTNILDEKETLFFGFYISYYEARNHMKRKALKKLDSAMEKEWKVAAWFLEKRYPHEYGHRSYVQSDHTVAAAGPSLAGLDLDEKKAYRALLKKAAESGDNTE